MAYILRTHIKTKYFIHGLKSIFGLNYPSSLVLCRKLGFSEKFLTDKLTFEQIQLINDLVQDLNLLIKSDLQRFVKSKISNLISIRSFRGFRHRQGLPCRGQRSHTNAKTQKKLRSNRKY